MRSSNKLKADYGSISGSTLVCGVIADPVAHTISPQMYNAAFQKLGLDYIHIPFQVDRDNVPEAVKGIRALNIQGVNVTMPHKLTVIPYLDEMEPLAKRIGAVNAIINTKGVLKGYNFDAPGFLQPLLDSGFQPEGKRVVVLGAGGGARAVTFALAGRGANLTILNRLEEYSWAEKLGQELSQYSGKGVPVLELKEEVLEKVLKEAELLVNATCVGFDVLADQTPVPERLLRADLPVYDIVFSPLKTRLLAEAEKKGAKIIPGMEMIIGQGKIFFEVVTGAQAPLDVMRSTLIKVLKAREK